MELMNQTYELSALSEIADQLAVYVRLHEVVTFEGELGAGKTTLIKEICHQLGVAQSVQSPTFSLVNEYVDAKGQPVYHFDLYRLKNAQEAFDIGLEEYLDSGHLCLIEWPEQAEEFWTFEHLELNVSHVDDAHRKLEVVWRRY
jgi:tRNA threonylcarbamoyladenosine biosynthesis protein TsaE